MAKAILGHLIRDERDYEAHINYVHYNPVKHGYVNRAVDWPYSSIHEFVSKGLIGVDWGIDVMGLESEMFGERL